MATDVAMRDAQNVRSAPSMRTSASHYAPEGGPQMLCKRSYHDSICMSEAFCFGN